MLALVGIADWIKNMLEKVAFASGWLLVVLMFITTFDIVCRKLGIPIPLTKFQEMEYYLHTTVFSFWMGYNYSINTHPRVDSYTEQFSLRIRAWIELIGCLVFALPFMLMIVYYGWDFFYSSMLQNEASENSSGLPWRWVMKGIFYLGMWFVVLGIISMMLRLIAFLFGGLSQAETKLDLGHVELEA